MEQTTNKEGEAKAFVEAAFAKGASEEGVGRMLSEAGWSAHRVNRIFQKVYEERTGLAVPAASVSHGESAKDAFLHLLSFATLSTWVGGLASLLYTLIDQYIPDAVANTNVYYSSPSYSISTQLACIIVAFPVYVWITWLINRDISRNPERAESSVRKWLTYLALFIAAGLLIGDVITFLAALLQGELTTRFVLKVITVLVLAGGVLWYYLAAVKKRS